jgi:hypothetical protein
MSRLVAARTTGAAGSGAIGSAVWLHAPQLLLIRLPPSSKIIHLAIILSTYLSNIFRTGTCSFHNPARVNLVCISSARSSTGSFTLHNALLFSTFRTRFGGSREHSEQRKCGHRGQCIVPFSLSFVRTMPQKWQKYRTRIRMFLKIRRSWSEVWKCTYLKTLRSSSSRFLTRSKRHWKDMTTLTSSVKRPLLYFRCLGTRVRISGGQNVWLWGNSNGSLRGDLVA